MSDTLDNLLVVEDDKLFGGALRPILESLFIPHIVHSMEEARQALLTTAFAGVMLDIRLGGTGSTDTNGIVLLKEIKENRPLMPVIVMTNYADIQMAVQAMKLGANDFVDKHAIAPERLAREVNDVISRVRASLKTESEAAQLRQFQTADLIGSSPALNPLRKAISLAAQDGFCNTLILGETGTGKEVVAKAIHAMGKRRGGPFVPVHMMALSPTLVESELFGHEKNAFTGAGQARIGYIEQAEGGVLFLDEIGDASAEMQVKLLRFVQERVVHRVGSTRGRPVNVQIIAATNQPLLEFIAMQKFRSDLYYRLKTVEIVVPPLRDRREDIPQLAEHFLGSLRKAGRTRLTGFSKEAILALRQYEWPGNIRQLQQTVEWAILSAMQESHWIVELDDLPAEVVSESHADAAVEPGGGALVERARAQAELECIDRVLAQTLGRKTDAMQRLGYPNRQTMRRRVQHLRERYPDLWTKYQHIADAYKKTSEADSQ